MNKLMNYLFMEPNMLLAALWARIGLNFNDEIYLQYRYFFIFKKKLNLKNPEGFNEKINWLKIYNRIPYYTDIADKSLVKTFIINKIGKRYVIPTLGVWDSFDDISFDSLPNQFVLKSTNGGGGTGVIICKNKASFDKVNAKLKLESSMKSNWKIEREWIYRDIKPKIIAEEYICNVDGGELVDYKFFCFNGEPKLLFIASDRYESGESLKFDWYDMDLNHLPIISKGYKNSNKQINDFPEFSEMKEIARQLSEAFPFIRVDLYLIDHKVYFGELTFFHDGGVVALRPTEWEYIIGSWIKLPEKTIEP